MLRRCGLLLLGLLLLLMREQHLLVVCSCQFGSRIIVVHWLLHGAGCWDRGERGTAVCNGVELLRYSGYRGAAVQ